MKTCNIAAYDLGQSGGKISLGRFDGEKLAAKTVFRHPNSAVRILNDQYWDFSTIIQMRDRGLFEAARLSDGEITAVSSTAFGNTFALIDRYNRFFSAVYAFYPERMEPGYEELTQMISAHDLHLATGCECRTYITAAQLMAYRALGESVVIDNASKLLLLPDAMNYTLSGIAAAEETAASIGGLYDLVRHEWSDSIIEQLGFRRGLFPETAAACTVQGEVLPEVCDRLQLKRGALVVNAAGHDTASAAYALPETGNTAFISIGTMALIGIEGDGIMPNEASYKARFGCWAAPDGRHILAGSARCMWHIEKALQYLKARGETYSYEQMITMAEQEPKMVRVYEVDDDAFLSEPERLPEHINDCLERTNQHKCETAAQLFRCIFDSIASAIIGNMRKLKNISGIAPDSVYVLGGGGRNVPLMHLLADELNMRVIVPDYEATSYGVMIAELVAIGKLNGRSEAKELIARSINRTVYEPSSK